MVRPARSALFSPRVKRPLTLKPGKGSNWLYWCARAVLRRVELLAVGRRPPVGEVAGSVPFRALVVEAVARLVADHGADAAIVGGVVGRGLKKGGCRIAAGKTISFMLGL